MLAWNASAQAIGGQNTALLANLIPVTVFAIQIVRGYRPAALELVGAAITLGAVTANNLLLRRRDAALVVATEER
jgi:drug/metabolite transporter (DMT)-like permease